MNQAKQSQTRRDIEARIIAKAWKDETYKQELLAKPKAVIEREFEIQLPAEVNVQVIEENTTSLCFVLPMRPEVPGQELSEEDLETVAGGSWSLRTKVAGSLAASAFWATFATGAISAK